MKYFQRQEFFSPDTEEEHMQQFFLEALERARYYAGTPFKITSGYRTKAHNKAVGGVRNSFHTKGLAVDIAKSTSAVNNMCIEWALLQEGFRVLEYKTHYHADLTKRSKKPYVYQDSDMCEHR